MFDNDQLYSIGQAAEICDVSRRTLRFYEIKGLISPDHLSEGGYRYYTMETLRRVQVIRYFLEEGFSLDQAGKLLNTNDLDDYEEVFRDQIQKTLAEIDFYRNRMESLKGWYGLLCEGKRVRLLGQDNFTLKHIPTRNYMFLEDYLDGDIYYRIERPAHNLDRARCQCRLLADMEGKRAEMDGIVLEQVKRWR